MTELWALLHFIMPNFFDSHEHFSEWFTKDIESQSHNKGNKMIDEKHIKRLHKVLKPFMLRRVKADVESELGPKKEVDIMCQMTFKQKTFYQ